MYKTGKDDSPGIPSGFGFKCTVNAVLSDGKKGFHMSVAPAGEREGMGNIFNMDFIYVRAGWSKMGTSIIA